MRIPVGAFGNRVPDVVGGPRPQQGDGGVGEAAVRLGATVAHVARAENNEQAYLEEQEKRQRLHEILDQNRTREAADKATASARSVEIRDTLDTLNEEFDNGITTGEIDKTKAIEEYRKRAKSVIEEGVKGVPDAYLANVQGALNHHAARVETKVSRAVTKRDRGDTLAGIEQTLEYGQRLATTDPAAGTKLGIDALDQLGPFAGLPPDAIAKRKQQFLEGVSYTRAYTAIYTARTDNAALKKADSFIAADETLDPQKKATLLATSSGFQASNAQRAEAAAAAAQRKQEAHLKRAEAEANSFQMLADKGGFIDPAETARAIAATAGTPYQKTIAAAAQAAVETGGLARTPLTQQREALAKIDGQIAASGRTEALDKRRGQIERVLTAAEADIKRDALQAYVERGGGKAPDLDTSSPQGLASSIAGRVAYAQQAQQWAEKPVSPLFEAESERVRDMLTVLPAKERSKAVQAIANALPPAQAAALARQMDPKDGTLARALAASAPIGRNADGSVVNLSTTTGRYASELMFKGQQAQKDGTSTKGEKTPGVKAGQWKANIAAQLADVFPGQSLTDNAVAGALDIAHGIASEANGALSDDDLQRAVRLTIGGELIEHNGRKIPLPPNVDAGALETRLRTITPDEVAERAGGATVRAGGVEIPTTELAKKLPGAELMFAGPGRYMVIVNGRPVTGKSGKPVIIPL